MHYGFGRQRNGRVAALAFACISLISIPIGTTLGVYTLAILLPRSAGEIYARLQPSAAVSAMVN